MEPQSRTSASNFGDELVAMMPRLRRFCLSLCGNRDVGDNLMQAVLERALTKQEQFRPGSRLDYWLYRMARNLQIDMARAAKARGGEGVPLDEAMQCESSDGRLIVEQRSELSLAGQAFMALPDGQREVFALVVLDGLAYREAAALLDLPIGTIMSRIARARASINAFVMNRGKDDGDDDD